MTEIQVGVVRRFGQVVVANGHARRHQVIRDRPRAELVALRVGRRNAVHGQLVIVRVVIPHVPQRVLDRVQRRAAQFGHFAHVDQIAGVDVGRIRRPHVIPEGRQGRVAVRQIREKVIGTFLRIGVANFANVRIAIRVDED